MPDGKLAYTGQDGHKAQDGDGRDSSKGEVAAYIYDMLTSLQKIAAANDFEVLTHLIGAARAAAKAAR